MVYEIKEGIFQVLVNIDGEWLKDKMIEKWMLLLKRNYSSAYNTRKTYASGLNIFLHYYIYCPQEKNQSLVDYLLEFREKLILGISISSTRMIKTKRIYLETEYILFKKEPSSVSTINTYMNGIQKYLSFLKTERVDEQIDSLLTDEVDWKQLKRKSIQGKGGGYGLIMSPLVAQVLANKIKIIKDLKQDRKSSKLNSYFPPEIFNELLDLCDDREKCLYLLCGFAGARVGQALSLTRDDYDMESREVYIVDPLSHETGPSGKVPRFKLLKEHYNINMEKNPYKYIASKYPIPLQYTELLWINKRYREIFLKSLSSLDKGNPVLNKHPFIFNTSKGKILTPNESSNIFKRKINKLKKEIYQEWIEKSKDVTISRKEMLDIYYKYLLKQLNKSTGLHSLRHMYGVIWGDLVDKKVLSIENAELLCQFGMGHSSKESIYEYFTIKPQLRSDLFNKYYLENDTYLNERIFKIKQYNNRSFQ
jgi:integrase